MSDLERDIKRRAETVKFDADTRTRITQRLAKLGIMLDCDGNMIGNKGKLPDSKEVEDV